MLRAVCRVPKRVPPRAVAVRALSVQDKSPNALRLTFAPFESVDEWLRGLDVAALRADFLRDGALRVDGLINKENVEVYAGLYKKMLDGSVDSSKHRHDLGSHIKKDKGGEKEHVCQIMWPSLYFNAEEGPLHGRALALGKALLGDDMAFDFDHLIFKAPGSDNPFPWHQDEGYWRLGMNNIEFPDLRATSIWVALDDATVDNGCMWMVPGSHKLGYFHHAPVQQGYHTIEVQGADAEIEAGKRAYPVKAGGAVLNTGRTLHYTGGNQSQRERKAFIVNLRPQAMVDFERQCGFDHLKGGFQSKPSP